MKIKNSLQFSWFILCILNNIAIILGLHLPFNFPCLRLKLSKLPVAIFFVIICSTSISLIDAERHGNKKYAWCQQVYTVFLTWCSCKIIVNRYRKPDCIKRLYCQLSSISEYNEKSVLTAKENATQTLKKIMKLFRIISFIFIISYSVHTNESISYCIIHEYVMFTILIFESFLLIETLDILRKNIKISRSDLKRIYKDFHKIPPAELQKSENGDLILVSWITRAMDFNHKKLATAHIRELFNIYFLLKECIDDFNVAFGSSICSIILVFTAKLLEIFWVSKIRKTGDCESLLAAIFDWLYILVNCVIVIVM